MNANPYRDFVAEPKTVVRPAPVPAPQGGPQPVALTVECGSGWYHDVAIAESKQTPARKH